MHQLNPPDPPFTPWECYVITLQVLCYNVAITPPAVIHSHSINNQYVIRARFLIPALAQAPVVCSVTVQVAYASMLTVI